MPFARLKLEPWQHQVGHVGRLQPGVLMREHQLPIKENHDCKQHRGPEQLFAIRFQVAMIHGVTNEKRFDRTIGGGFRPLAGIGRIEARSIKSIGCHLAGELPLRERKVSAKGWMDMNRTAAWAVILVAAMAPGWAQDPNAGDAPDHGVARLSLVQGNVSMRHGDLGELSPAAVNIPLVTTDRVVTGDQGAAEIQFDFSNMIRLGVSSEVRLSQLEFKRYQVQIAAGITTFRVMRDPDPQTQVEISTPTVSLHPLRAGTYRIS